MIDCGEPGTVKYFDMTEGIAPVRNIVGLGDPDVHKIGDRWVMFLGGATTNLFKVNLFCATLPPGAPLNSNDWSLITSGTRPRVARSLVAQPASGSWDAYGLHTPSYVRGIDPARGEQERVYYSGRSSRSSTGPTSRFAIGYLERSPVGWARYGEPVLTGTPDRPSVLEPIVRYYQGKWRMWYLSTSHEAGPGEQPDHQLEYVESDDGTTGWSAPKVLFTTADGFFDNDVIEVDGGYEMVVARGHNLFDTPNFPRQGMWWLSSRYASGNRADWTSEPVRLLDDTDPLPWYANGAFGPSLRYGDTDADRDTLYVFFTGVYSKLNWPGVAIKRVLGRKKPPVPAPFYFAVGRMQCSRRLKES